MVISHRAFAERHQNKAHATSAIGTSSTPWASEL
jgi:hypothetical protein